MDLKEIYLTALARSAPDLLVQSAIDPSMPRNVVSIGKCAAALLDGAARAIEIADAIAALPEGYPQPASPARVVVGGHPDMTPASFAAGRALVEFVETHRDVLFLVSGGGSACAEVAMRPFSEDDVAARNRELVASGASIGEINAARRAMSAIKGGRLGDRVRGHKITLVYSDVATGALHDVASGPTIRRADEAMLIADNNTLVEIAAAAVREQGRRVRFLGGAGTPLQLESDVAVAAKQLAELARTLAPGEVLVAGGEPTVVRTGSGRGGRCSELAIRFALESGGAWPALFGSSDGVDGSSGSAGVLVHAGRVPDRARVAEALAESDSASVVAQVGEPIMIAPTGNNLRDLFLVARD